MSQENFDVYGDLDMFNVKTSKEYVELEAELAAVKAELEAKINENDQMKWDVMDAEGKIETLEGKIKVCEENFRMFYEVIQAELKRRDNMIAEARRQRDGVLFRRHKNMRDQTVQAVVGLRDKESQCDVWTFPDVQDPSVTSQVQAGENRRRGDRRASEETRKRHEEGDKGRRKSTTERTARSNDRRNRSPEKSGRKPEHRKDRPPSPKEERPRSPHFDRKRSPERSKARPLKECRKEPRSVNKERSPKRNEERSSNRGTDGRRKEPPRSSHAHKKRSEERSQSPEIEDLRAKLNQKKIELDELENRLPTIAEASVETEKVQKKELDLQVVHDTVKETNPKLKREQRIPENFERKKRKHGKIKPTIPEKSKEVQESTTPPLNTLKRIMKGPRTPDEPQPKRKRAYEKSKPLTPCHEEPPEEPPQKSKLTPLERLCEEQKFEVVNESVDEFIPQKADVEEGELTDSGSEENELTQLNNNACELPVQLEDVKVASPIRAKTNAKPEMVDVISKILEEKNVPADGDLIEETVKRMNDESPRKPAEKQENLSLTELNQILEPTPPRRLPEPKITPVAEPEVVKTPVKNFELPPIVAPIFAEVIPTPPKLSDPESELANLTTPTSTARSEPKQLISQLNESRRSQNDSLEKKIVTMSGNVYECEELEEEVVFTATRKRKKRKVRTD